jgi:2-hydroxy-3-oxopropionate reductase
MSPKSWAKRAAAAWTRQSKNATLSIMVFDEVKPVFEVMGKTITLCGDRGADQTVKACNQIQVALNFVGLAEAFVLGAKAGVDPAIILQVLSGGYAQTRVMDVRGRRFPARLQEQVPLQRFEHHRGDG